MVARATHTKLVSVMRSALYTTLTISSLILIALTAAHINYTIHLQHTQVTALGNVVPGETENVHDSEPLGEMYKAHFIEPIFAEILATALLSGFWSIYVMVATYKRGERVYTPGYYIECTTLFALGLMWMAGATFTTATWPNLSSCSAFSQCRIVTGTVGMSWIGFIITGILLIVTLNSPPPEKAPLDHATLAKQFFVNV